VPVAPVVWVPPVVLIPLAATVLAPQMLVVLVSTALMPVVLCRLPFERL